MVHDMARTRDRDHTADPVDRTAGQGPARPLLVLRKVSSILDAFTPERPQLTLAEIRRATGLPPSTCLRLLQNMCASGFLSRDGESYRISVRMLQWMTVALDAVDVVGLATPVLRDLRDRTDETACLFVKDDLSRVVVAIAGSRQGTVRRLHVGEVLPLHAGSAGKVLLAHDAQALGRVLAGQLQSFTSSTIVDPEALEHAVDEARSRGYAMSVNEGHQSASSVSAPVFDHRGLVVAAVCLAGPTERFNEETMPRWIDVLVAAADDLTGQIGGRAPRSGVSHEVSRP
jgi:DNA-binding IclR family transcriptional regulator